MAKLTRDNLDGVLDAPHPFYEAMKRSWEPTEMDLSMAEVKIGDDIDKETGKIKDAVARRRAVWLMLTAAKEAGLTVEVEAVDTLEDLEASSRWIRRYEGTVMDTAIDPAEKNVYAHDRWLIQGVGRIWIINPNLVVDIAVKGSPVS